MIKPFPYLRQKALLVRAVPGCHGGLGLVGKGEEELSQATLSGGIVSQDWGECRVAQRLGEALAKCFAGASIV